MRSQEVRLAALLIYAGVLGAQTVQHPLKIENGVVAPTPKKEVDPRITADMPAGDFEVVVHAVVDERGMPTHVTVRRSAGGAFDNEAVAAVQQYQFEPATLAGKPVAVELDVAVEFHIAASAPDAPITTPKTDVVSGITPPRLIKQAAPHMTSEMRKAAGHTEVILQMTIDEHGMPTNTTVMRSGGEAFDREALAAVSKYRFVPAKKNGKPIPVQLNVTINFE